MLRLVAMITAALFAVVVSIQRRNLAKYRSIVGEMQSSDDASVSSTLVRDVLRIGRIALPSIRSKAGIYNIIFVLLFAVKAACRAWASTADGGVLRSMVAPNFVKRSFQWALVEKGTAVVLGAVASGVIEHLRHWLITAYRVRLTKHFHERFYSQFVYYQGTSVDGRLRDADTAIVEYCGEFAEHFAELPYYFVLPFLEASVSMAALVRQTGLRTALPMTGVVVLSMAALRHIAPPFGKIHASVLARQEILKKGHVAAINKVELIALYNAGQFTKQRLDEQLAQLDDALNEMALAKGHFEVIENTISWLWNLSAYIIAMAALPDTFGKRKAIAVSRIVVQLRLMNDFNSSVKDFIVNFREMSHLSEFTTKLVEFESTLQSIASGDYAMALDAASPVAKLSPSPFSRNLLRGVVCHAQYPSAADQPFSLVKLDQVNVSNPKGNLLVQGLNFDIRSDQNWAIVGPNGCGKSSILRLLAGLWPPTSGTLTFNKEICFYFLPQEEYLLTHATLLEQIAFPDTVVVKPDGRVADDELAVALRAVQLATASKVVEVIGGQEGSFFGASESTADRSFDWSSLSGGQRQKLSLTRVFFHAVKNQRDGRMQLCVLDESTSAMDHDSETCVFENLRAMGLHFISVTHREEVLRHHSHILQLDTKADNWRIVPRSQ